ncbi:MAG: 6,7-dimethyl-8-ribityllumazine synthase [Chlamydiales bacterium]|nr:6,7-dimethyl-8-ribityllumazine synthase [Chlamydiales bacterium]
MQKVERHDDTIDLATDGHCYALVVARFNFAITSRLLAGAKQGLQEHGVEENQIAEVWVPGAFELPLVAKKLAESKKYDAVICLGAVIRGETAHFEHVADQAASGILQASLATDTPVLFSVLTTETLEQAQARAGEKESNSGYHGALSAIEMVNLLKKI